jgi:hypothetical protein
MKQTITAAIITVLSCLWINSVSAYDCSGLPEWDRQVTYQSGDQVQYSGVAYEANATATKPDRPDRGDPWVYLDSCETGGDPPPPPSSLQPISIYGVWHCGNHYCDWSVVRDTSLGGEFDDANHWIIDRGNGTPSVNLVVLSFLEPLELLYSTNYADCDDGTPDPEGISEVIPDGVPVGMTPDVVDYFKIKKDPVNGDEDRGIRVLLSMGGVTYTESWNAALTIGPEKLACLASQAVKSLGADGLEIDWENGTPDDNELDGIERFIDTYNLIRNSDPLLENTLLTMDLAVGDRYLQELSRRAAADWLLPFPDPEDPEKKMPPKIDYINAMVPRGEPSTDQWQEHVDGKLNYNPPILPKDPAKVVVSLWLTDGRRPNANCVDFDSSSQLEKAEYIQTVRPNPGCGENCSAGFLGYMFWAAECPSTRNVCTTPPDACEVGMGGGASYFNIPLPIDSETPLRQALIRDKEGL